MSCHFPDGRFLSWCGGYQCTDYTICLWELDGELLKIMDGHTDQVEGVKSLPDGRILSWSHDKTLRLWDSDGNPAKTFEGHAQGINGVLFCKKIN